jgi:hypothetical protein
LVQAETIEKEVCDDQIEGARRRDPSQSVSMNEVRVCCQQVEAPEPASGERQHLGAGVHASDVRGWQPPPAFCEKAAIAFPNNQDALGIGRVV